MNIFYLSVAATSLTSDAMRLFAPMIVSAGGASPLHAGMFGAAFAFGSLIFVVPAGVLADRIDSRSLAIAAVFLLALSPIGLYFRSLGAVIYSGAVCGIALQMLSQAQQSYFFRTKDSAAAMGIFIALIFLPRGVGMFAGGFAYEVFGMRAYLMLMSVIPLAALPWIISLPPLPLRTVPLAAYRAILTSPRIIFLCSLFALSAVHWGVESVCYTPYLKSAFGMGGRDIGIISLAGAVVMSLSALAGGRLLSRGIIAERTIFFGAFIITGSTLVLMGFLQHPLMILFVLAHQVGEGIIFLSFYRGIGMSLSGSSVGGTTAIFALANLCGVMTGALLSGMGGAYAPPAVLIGMSGLLVLLVPCVFAVRGRRYAPA